MKICHLLLSLCIVFGATVLLSASTGEPDPQPEANLSEDQMAWDAIPPLEKANLFFQQGDFKLAEKACVKLLESPIAFEEKKDALLLVAEIYAEMGLLAKAVHSLENCLASFPHVDDRPAILFRLAELYRDIGLKTEAVATFYRVLNVIVVSGEERLNQYVGTARRAQFEIARLHYEEEAFERAYLLFDRIDLLSLDDPDREIVLYYKALASLKSGKHRQALDLMDQFSIEFDQSPMLAEVMYLKAETLYRMDRLEACDYQLIRVLEAVGPPGEEHLEEWNFWRKQAGNRLANRHYQQGDYRTAVRIYQGMVGLDPRAEWQLPIVFQIGLSFERAGLLERAVESYSYILQETEFWNQDGIPLSLLTVKENASWHRNMLQWRLDLQEKGTEVAFGEQVTPKPNDASGS
jgi:tetratricopeptide (TPR) repeat protein